jgi:hypothetical protein
MSELAFDPATTGDLVADRVRSASAASVAAKAQPGADIPEGSQDWQLLVTEGHVRGHRLLDAGKSIFPAALLSGLVGGFLCLGALTGALSFLRAPPSLVSALTTDPAHYAVVPGYAEKGDYRFSWLAVAVGTPRRGLTAEGWQQLVRATASDLPQYGTNVSEYVAIPKLQTPPIVTRPAKALTEHVADLANGIIAISPVKDSTIVVAWVEGKLAGAYVSTDGTAQCNVGRGPAVNGCADDPSLNVFNALKPKTAGGN